MQKYKDFSVVASYPEKFKTPFTCFVWCKGGHFKAHAYGKNEDDSMWGLGSSQDEALREAVDNYWYYENIENNNQ